MKKIARYKLNKITKELSATTVQSRPAESVGKRKAPNVSFVCLSVSNWRFMKSFKRPSLGPKLVDSMISRTEKSEIIALL